MVAATNRQPLAKRKKTNHSVIRWLASCFIDTLALFAGTAHLPAYSQACSDYPAGIISIPAKNDPGRQRDMTYFTKTYGNNPQEVEKHLSTVAWMPHIFHDLQGHPRFLLQVTTINGVANKIKSISAQCELLVEQHPEYIPYLDHPEGMYESRYIAGTHMPSMHSFGIAFDLNQQHNHYWRTDLAKVKNLTDDCITENIPVLAHQNQLPWDIILIFEQHGFIWGGKWHHYDTQHFEYRPECFN